MKLLLIAEKYPPVVGGGETHLHQLACDLVRLGHEVCVLTEECGIEGAEGYRDDTHGVTLFEVAGLVDACQNFSLSAAIGHIYDVLQREKFDVVHVFNYVPAIMVSLIRSSVDCPLVVSLFETHVPDVRVFDHYQNYGLERSLQQALSHNLRQDLMICGSQAYVRWALDGGFNGPVEVIPFGTDLERFRTDPAVGRAERARLGWDRDFVCLVPARPVPRKRLEDVIDAISMLHQPQFRLVLTAPTGRCSPEYVDFLTKRAESANVADQVTWIEGYAWDDMPLLYAACDVVVLPSAQDGWGIALNEAMAAGVPVITTDIEGHDEVVRDGITGQLYEAGNVTALAASLKRVVDRSSEVRQMAAEAHRDAIDRFDRQAVARRHETAYASLLTSSHVEQTR